MVSIKDIARQANVSHSTVSRALTDSPLVNPDTKARIRRIAAEMGYTPSAIARAMSTRQTRTVGLVVTTIADPFVANIVRGIEETALDHGYSVILSNSTGDPEREIAAVRALREKWVDAVIVTSSWVGSFYAELSEIRVPVVLVNNQQAGAYSFSVRSDDLHGGQLAGRYLVGLGHRLIAYITGPEHATSSELRLQGLCQAGVEVPAQWVVHGDGLPEGGVCAVEQLVARPPLPSAVFCYNDQTAMGALHALKLHGLRVPQDISVLGYDDIAAAPYLDPPLTTVAQAKHRLGQLAMHMVLDLLNQREVARDVLIEPVLVIRSSCAAPTS